MRQVEIVGRDGTTDADDPLDLLRRGLVELRRRQADGPCVDARVRVPVQAAAQRDFGRRVLELLETHELAAPRLVVELVVRKPLEHAGSLKLNLALLRGRGVGLGLADMGSGHAALTWLGELPLSDLRIERLLVQSITQSPKAGRIVRWVISLAQSRGLRSCAEGVATAEQLDFLVEHGCDLAQGRQISQTLPGGLWHLGLHGEEVPS